MHKNVISVIDGEAGSCGKAKVIGEIATDRTIKLGASVTNCMPNAGHTFVDEKGNSFVFRNIPVSSVNPLTELFIGPGSAIDMKVFRREYKEVSKYLKGRKIYVHEMVPLIERKHKLYEQTHVKSGSTFKGCGAVSKDKVMRDEKLKFFEGYKNAVVVSNDEWLDRLYEHLDNRDEYVMLEGAQGCDLSLNHSGNYPYVTSRNVSTMQLLADSGIPAERLLETIMVIRPFPIRISNITRNGDVIYTGAYGTGEELTWTQINLASMYGGYPYKGDIYGYKHKTPSDSYIKKLLAHTNEIYLKQLFGINYRNISINELDLLTIMELERLMYKSKGETYYESKILDLGFYDSDFAPNTIFDQSEQTTVTKMERRVFDLDINKVRNNVRINDPYGIYLNFFQHLSYDFKDKVGSYKNFYFGRDIYEYISYIESKLDTPILALGTGAKNGSRILKQNLIKGR